MGLLLLDNTLVGLVGRAPVQKTMFVPFADVDAAPVRSDEVAGDRDGIWQHRAVDKSSASGEHSGERLLHDLIGNISIGHAAGDHATDDHGDLGNLVAGAGRSQFGGFVHVFDTHALYAGVWIKKLGRCA